GARRWSTRTDSARTILAPEMLLSLFPSSSSSESEFSGASSRALLVDLLDSAGASAHDVRLRRRALEASGLMVHAIACGGSEPSEDLPDAGVTWAEDEARALALATRWLHAHPGAGILVASGVRGGGAIARRLAEFGAVEWWPSALASSGPGWLDRARPAAPRVA